MKTGFYEVLEWFFYRVFIGYRVGPQPVKIDSVIGSMNLNLYMLIGASMKLEQQQKVAQIAMDSCLELQVTLLVSPKLCDGQ